jgi:long-subunit acyl-CoA synthetase (AMP-forming)
MLEFGAMARASLGVAELYPSVGPKDRILCHLPLAHIAERQISGCGSMFGGFQVFFTDSLETFAADLKRAHPTLFFTVPRLWQKFYLAVSAKLPPKRLAQLLRVPLVSRAIKKLLLRMMGLDAVRIAAVGAAPMPADLFEWYRKLGLELLDAYGMSENCGYSHGSRIGRVRPGYAGEPLPGVEFRLGDDGEILVKSPGAFSGYFKDPELTASSFTPDGFFHTGDRGELDELGRLRITGRVKELFKTSKGKYVAPAPIENQLVTHPKLEVACVTGHGREQPFALVVPGAGAAIDAREIETHLTAINRALESHERLAFVVVVREPWTTDNGLITPTMKVRRGEVEQRYGGHVDGWYAAGKTVLWHG